MIVVEDRNCIQIMNHSTSWLLHNRLPDDERCEKVQDEPKEEEQSMFRKRWLPASQILPSSWNRLTRSLPYSRLMTSDHAIRKRVSKKQQSPVSDAVEEGEILAEPLNCNKTSSVDDDEEKNLSSSRSFSFYEKNKRLGVTHEPGWSIDSVSLAPRCIHRLKPGGLLDDSLLEFFFRFIIRYAVPYSLSQHIFFFNSYFYTKLIESGENSTSKQRHHAVRRWTNKLRQNGSKKNFRPQAIWEFDLVVVPLNPGGTHWTLALITFPILAVKPLSETLQAKTSFSSRLKDSLESMLQRIPTSVEINSPGIFHLDSLKDSPGPPLKLKETLVAYFQEEFFARQPDAAELYKMANVDEWKFAHVPAPKQNNTFDCGIFLIEYIRFLLSQPERVTKLLYGALTDKPQQQFENPSQRSTLNSSAWFNQTVVTHRRTCLKTMLLHMQRYQKWSNEPSLIHTLVQILNSSTPEELQKAVLTSGFFTKKTAEKNNDNGSTENNKFQQDSSDTSSQITSSLINYSSEKTGSSEYKSPEPDTVIKGDNRTKSPKPQISFESYSRSDIGIAHSNKKSRKSRVMAFSEEAD